MAKSQRERLGISAEEYKEYQKVRKLRNSLNKKLAKDFAKSQNDMFRKFSAVRQYNQLGKKLSLSTFRNKEAFQRFMTEGLKYTDYKQYMASKVQEYEQNMFVAFVNLGMDSNQMKRYEQIIKKVRDNYKSLEEIYSNSEELDISYIYITVMEEGIERIDYILDVLEALVEKEIAKGE